MKEMERLKTIQEWAELAGITIVDLDGFDRKDPHLESRVFTKAEFNEGLLRSTVMVGRERKKITRYEKIMSEMTIPRYAERMVRESSSGSEMYKTSTGRWYREKSDALIAEIEWLMEELGEAE